MLAGFDGDGVPTLQFVRGARGIELHFRAGAENRIKFGKPDFDGKDWEGWKKSGQEVCGKYADPMFADPDRLDFRLKPGSPALALGFKSFDWSTAGVRPEK